jgi:4a-hydroxytetrahydrobiopterin dehydratase
MEKWTDKSNKLEKEFTFGNFVQAVEFINEIAKIAESQDHHPDIYLHSYNKLKVTLSTHSEGRVTEKDRMLAELIDKINR